MAADPVQEIDRFLNDDNNELARMDIDGAAAAAQPLARADGAIGPAQQEAGANQPVVPQAAVAAAVPEHQAEAAGAPLQQGQNRRDLGEHMFKVVGKFFALWFESPQPRIHEGSYMNEEITNFNVLNGTISYLQLLTVFGSLLAGAEIEIDIVTSPVEHAEGPHWDTSSDVLFYVDIQLQNIWRFDPRTGSSTYVHINNGPVGAVVPVENTADEFIAASGREVLLVKWDVNENEANPLIRKLTSIDKNRTDTRVNDGKCDPAGRFWIGTMAIEVDNYIRPNRGSLYRIGQDLFPKQVFTPVSISNGLVWNRRNDTMYYIDSPTRQLAAFDFDLKSGRLSRGRVIFDLGSYLPKSIPDGMTIDSNGHLWVALYNGSAIIQVDPIHGRRLRTVDLPAPRITSVAFGGPQLDILYVTSARFGMSEEEKEEYPFSGSVFAIRGLGVQGLPMNSFKYYYTAK
ncbi:hypothetical protein QAD02_018332 [Eretmocerus hayati]|uniref:Uncharacterized protein n=1 Tax=Eretmocerus hayati TaxID=131215 RepID=A0ACC2PG33_9HYME|nr:hypothetical protein QAD02_018332 [Eretmocerus hayati]